MGKKQLATLALGVLVVLIGVISAVTALRGNTESPDSGESSPAPSSAVPAPGGSEAKTGAATPSHLQASDRIVTDTYHVTRGDIELYGVLTAPEGYRDRVLPTVVISHGFNNTLEMYEDYAQHLAQQGYLVYRFDFYGGSRQSKSGGTDMLNMSVKTELDDLTAVIDALTLEPFVDADTLTLLGVSQGGVVSTLYAAEDPDAVKQLVLIFPAYVLFDDVQATYQLLGVSSPDAIPPVLTHANTSLGAIYLQDALTIDIDERMRQVTADTLIIQGTDDPIVPYRYAVEAAETMSKAQLVTVTGGGHWIDADFNSVAIPAMDSFLATSQERSTASR